MRGGPPSPERVQPATAPTTPTPACPVPEASKLGLAITISLVERRMIEMPSNRSVLSPTPPIAKFKSPLVAAAVNGTLMKVNGLDPPTGVTLMSETSAAPPAVLAVLYTVRVGVVGPVRA